MTTIFLIASILISALAFQNKDMQQKLIFNPYMVHTQKQWYRYFSSGFIHADFVHLALNMFVLYNFGKATEKFYSDAFGERGNTYFFILYMSALPIALISSYIKNKNNPVYNSLGASGAVSAIVFSFIVFAPMSQFYLFGLTTLTLPGIIYGILYLVLCYYMSKKNMDNINHDAHLWGAIYGFAFTILLKPSLLVDFFHKLVFLRNVL